MSEYQYYEFLAVDRPLDDGRQAEVRALSTRATITASSFVNEYEWGDFGGDPHLMMERYYDAHLYLAAWGTHCIMLRLPRSVLDLDVVENYCVGDQLSAWTTDEFTVLALTSEDDDADDWEYEGPATLSAFVGLRTELAAGDLRPLYLAWLAGYGTWERDEEAFDPDADHDLEPLVPPGLTTLTAPQRALADFLRLDDDLLAVAAEASPPLDDLADDAGRLTTWVSNLPSSEKDRLLLRVMGGDAVRFELLHRFREETADIPANPRRTVADLLDAAARRRAGRLPVAGHAEG
jgi:hypothetical protein